MRLWSIHPCYLDPKGLVALWREGLLAQKVLTGATKGYKNHPQLIRFRATGNPLGAIAVYLTFIADEAYRRGYRFDRSKISKKIYKGKIAVTDGQIRFEFKHLLIKLKQRSPDLYRIFKTTDRIKLHPTMHKVRGGVESWEKRHKHVLSCRNPCRDNKA